MLSPRSSGVLQAAETLCGRFVCERGKYGKYSAGNTALLGYTGAQQEGRNHSSSVMSTRQL